MNDFCYLCFQREKRNLPIYYTEERKKNEQEEDNLLQMYTMLKDSEAIKKESVPTKKASRVTSEERDENGGIIILWEAEPNRLCRENRVFPGD